MVVVPIQQKHLYTKRWRSVEALDTSNWLRQDFYNWLNGGPGWSSRNARRRYGGNAA